MEGEAQREQQQQLVNAQTRIWNLSLSYLKSMALMTAVQLRIPDAVHRHGGPIGVPALAAAVGIPDGNVPALARLMRSLARCGVFGLRREGEQELYSPTILSQQLVQDDGPAAATAAPFTRLLVHQLLVTPWYSVASWFLGEGKPGAGTAFEVAYGERFFQSLGRLPEFGELFNNAMACDSRWSVGLVAREHPEIFRGLDSLVDVGGGDGTAAMAIKEVFPEMKCTVLELPHVAAAAPAVVGVDFVEGDMFQHVPPADAVLLKWVLHAFNDEDCRRILERCKEAILPARERGGRVIVMEAVVMEMDGEGDDVDMEAQHHMDLLMLSVTGGRQRNEGEWRRILAAAGFCRCTVTPALGPRSVIEAYL